jgi:cytochrome c oxidase subunit II
VKVHTYERVFLWLGGAVLVACLAALVYGSVGLGLHLPTKAGTIDPQAVAATPPFDRPGVRQVGPNAYEAVMIGRIWSFTPAQIEVPAGADITFVLTSADVIHGFNLEGTRVNMMLIPGQITRNRYRFKEPGEYTIICHEYCGVGHHTMYGKVVVK